MIKASAHHLIMQLVECLPADGQAACGSLRNVGPNRNKLGINHYIDLEEQRRGQRAQVRGHRSEGNEHHLVLNGYTSTEVRMFQMAAQTLRDVGPTPLEAN